MNEWMMNEIGIIYLKIITNYIYRVYVNGLVCFYF
jgi:hypothetical protein